MEFLIVGAFGVLGVLARFGLDRWFGPSLDSFPKATFLINIVGSFIAGLIYVLAERKDIPPLLQLGLLVGFCGGFTTFSAYALQAFQMIDRDRAGLALFYLLVSPVLGLAAAAIPVMLARKFFGPA